MNANPLLRLPQTVGDDASTFENSGFSISWQDATAFSPQWRIAPAAGGGASSAAAMAGSGAAAAAASALTPAATVTGGGLTFSNTFAPGLSAGYLSAIASTEKFLSNLFSNTLTLNLGFTTFNNPTGNAALTNSWSGWNNFSYATLKAALPASDILPATDPNPAGGEDWNLPEAYSRMLGLSTSTPKIDDTVSLNTAINWSFGQDVINGLIHEITEGGMGRVGGLGDQNGVFSTMDLFRYTADGTADLSDGRDSKTTFFSSNNGASVSNANQPQQGRPTLSFHNRFDGSLSRGGDTADFDQKDVFGTVSAGETISMNQVDLDVMQALGWKITLKQDVFNGSGDWETALHWSLGAMPITVMDAAIGGGFASVASLADDVTVNSIAVKSGSSLIIDGGATLTAIHGTTLNTADVSSSLSGNQGTLEVGVGGELLVGAGSSTVEFANSGSLDIGFGERGGAGSLLYGDGSKLTLDGGGDVYLGMRFKGLFSTGDIVGGDTFVNVDNAIFGGGLISGAHIDNQAHGVIVANQFDGRELKLRTTASISNEGQIDIGDHARMALGADGVTQTLANTGQVLIGDNGQSPGLKGDLAIAGNLAVSGNGAIVFLGNGSRLISDGAGPATLRDSSLIQAEASGQIGDAGVYGGTEDLTLINTGHVIADHGFQLTLNTGANVIGDGGGVLVAENGATLVLDSAVHTGVSMILSALPGGVIEAASGGTVDIAAAVSTGFPAGSPLAIRTGQVVVDAGSSVVVQSGGSIAIPVSIHGSLGATPGGTLTLQSGGAVSGAVAFTGPGGLFKDTSTAAGAFTFTGGGGRVQFASAGNTANISATGGQAEIVSGSGEKIMLMSAQVSVVGGSNAITFTGLGDQVAIAGAGVNADVVTGSNGRIVVSNSKISVNGGGDRIFADAGSALTLGHTAGQADAVVGSGVQVVLQSAAATITGSRNTISGGPGSSVFLAGTVTSEDLVFGSKMQISLNAASALIEGGGDAISLSAGSTVALTSTGGLADTLTGSFAQVALTSAQASVVGGGNLISATAGSGLSLSGTGALTDTVSASVATLALNGAQVALTGGNDSIAFTGTNVLGVTGSNEHFSFGAALGLQTITGFNLFDVIELHGSPWASFDALLASGDLRQSGANAIITTDAANTITLVNTQASSLTAAQFAFA